MAWNDSEADFFRAIENREIALRENSGFYTNQDNATNAHAGTYFSMSREYAIRTASGGTTGYVLHIHQQGSFINKAHVKDGSFELVRFHFNDLMKLDRFIPWS